MTERPKSTETIAGHEYSFGILDPWDAIDVQCVLVGVIGEPLMKMLATGVNAKTGEATIVEEDNNAAMGAALMQISVKLNPAEIKTVVTKLMKMVRYQGKPVNVVEHFNGRPRQLWEVAFYSLRYNFYDFFPESLIASVRKRGAKVLDSTLNQSSQTT